MFGQNWDQGSWSAQQLEAQNLANQQNSLKILMKAGGRKIGFLPCTGPRNWKSG
jgi:hypothetical protein